MECSPWNVLGVSVLVLSVGDVNGFQHSPAMLLALGVNFKLAMRCFGQEVLIFSSVWRGGVSKLGLSSWVASMVSVVVLYPEYIGIGGLLSVLALVLGGGSYCTVLGSIWNIFSIWRREVAKLGVPSCCYGWSVCMKYWEVGVCFRSSLLGSYRGGGHGRVIGVFVRRGLFFRPTRST